LEGALRKARVGGAQGRRAAVAIVGGWLR